MNIKYYFGAFAKYMTFEGRASRIEFWSFMLFHLIVSFGSPFLDQLLGTFSPDGKFGFVNIGYRLISFLPALAIGFRRMHDAGKSGVNFIVPVWNLIAAAMESEYGENEYGPNPHGEGNVNEEDLISQIGKNE